MSIQTAGECDILTGHKAIARFLGLSPRQISWHDERGNLPTFRIGRTVAARKSTLLQWIDEQEQAARDQRTKKR
ncbi:DNA-binding protein [Rhizobium lentis]|uniref:helix-turn-helix transcriptional regulator n=1 Tax=Rhizobium lentis TaxID=1138194 RepID=UPI001C83424B|nr:helix-turn-helix domain-containing protein [Rhizobium lentis]MBX5175315.1 DNA-binding protein [Rhizobium lentis]